MTPSPIRHIHQSLGATFSVEGDREIPAHYGNLQSEHAIVRKGVGITDLSHRGKLKVSGADRATYLQGLVTNDMLKLANGIGMHCAILTAKGKIQSYFRIFGVDDTFVIDVDGDAEGNTYLVLKRYLLYGIKAKLENLTGSYGHIALHGPLAESLLREALDQPMPELTVPHCSQIPLAKNNIVMAKTDEYGQEGYDLLMPNEHMAPVWEHIIQTAKRHNIEPFGAIGAEALETLRVEAGTPKLGKELDEEVFPAEAWLEEKAVSLSKGCYMGQETVARIDTYGDVKRRLTGLVISGDTIPAHGTEAMGKDDDPRAAGRVTSSVRSIAMNRVIALAFLRKKYLSPGTALTIPLHGGTVDATVVELPFNNSPN